MSDDDDDDGLVIDAEGTPADLTGEELARMPVFPLPRVVFFPGTLLPLHLFEPRYRKMIEDCMTRGPQVIAVTLLRPGWEADYQGRPAIHEIAGAGRIVGHRVRPDGTHDIALSGVCRVRLEEIPDEDVPYRVAKATVVPDDTRGRVGDSDKRALLSCASAVAAAVRRRHPDFDLGTEPDQSPGQLADAIADRLVGDAERRQDILETIPVDERVRKVTDYAGELLALLATHDTPS